MAAPRMPPSRLSGIMVPAPIQDLEALRALTALFKEQRNRNLDTIGVAVDLVLLFRELRVEQDSLLTAFRCGLQFLGNVASRNEESQSIVWVHAFPELFMSCLNHPDKKIVAYCSMILFTSLNAERMKDLEENLNIAINVIEAHQKHPASEWPFLIISDHFLKSPELVEAMYGKLSNQERITLLDIVIAKLVGEEQLTKDDISIFVRHAELIANSFMDQCRNVLKLTSEPHTEDKEALVTIRLLDVLCEMTSNTELLGYLQVFPGLMERVIDVLRVIQIPSHGPLISAVYEITSIGHVGYR